MRDNIKIILENIFKKVNQIEILFCFCHYRIVQGSNDTSDCEYDEIKN